MLGLLAEGLPSLRSSPQGARCTQAAWTIESYLYSANPGQAAAHGGRAEHCGAHTYAFKQSCMNDSHNEPVVYNRNTHVGIALCLLVQATPTARDVTTKLLSRASHSLRGIIIVRHPITGPVHKLEIGNDTFRMPCTLAYG